MDSEVQLHCRADEGTDDRCADGLSGEGERRESRVHLMDKGNECV